VTYLRRARTGPNGFAIGADGLAWIQDTRAYRIIRVSREGRIDRVIDMTPLQTSGQTALLVDDDALWVMDMDVFGQERILHLALTGELRSEYPLPEGLRMENGVTGMLLADDGAVLVELEFGRELRRFIRPDGTVDPEIPTVPLVAGGITFSFEYPELWGSVGAVTAGDVRTEIRVDHMLVGLRWLGLDGRDGYYVVVEEMPDAVPVQVDQTVWHIDRRGTVVTKARYPLADQYLFVPNHLAMGADDRVYAFHAHPFRVSVRPMRFVRALDPIFPPPETALDGRS
jgi:sugar lactone lactonase YvrE